MVGSKAEVELAKGPGLPGTLAKQLAVPSLGRPWPKPSGGGGAGPGLCPGHSGQAGSRGLLLSKATVCFNYKMAEGCVGHFVAPLEDKGRESQRVGPVDAWQGEERTTYQNKAMP